MVIGLFFIAYSPRRIVDALPLPFEKGGGKTACGLRGEYEIFTITISFKIKKLLNDIKGRFNIKFGDGTILVFFLVKISNQWRKNKMGITELIVIAFLAVLGFLAYNNSRKVAQELRRLGADK